MSEPSVLIYAELLSNIRQISVIAALDTPCNASTKVELSSNGQRFILNHKGSTTTLDLPGQVSSRAHLQKLALGSKELSWRLPVEGVFTREDAENARSNDGPWSAKTLGEESEFLCRSCDSVVIKKKTIKIWKDLPSENWAEMMDFWHCHKPDDHEDEHEHEVNGASGHTKIRQAGKSSTEKVSDSNANRGYGANTKFTAQTGIGFVDLTTFLLLDTDCLGLQIRELPDQSATGSLEYQPIDCKNCQNYIGYVDPLSQGTRLYKWRLKLPCPPSSPPPSTSLLVSSQLSTILQTQCLSRVLISAIGWRNTTLSTKHRHQQPATSSGESSEMPPSSSVPPTSSSSAYEDASASMLTSSSSSASPSPSWPSTACISIWVLTPGLRASATSSSVGEQSGSLTHPVLSGTFAMKVFWMDVEGEAAVKLVDSDTVEELSLPVEAIGELSACLRDSAALLPPSARRFQGWNVGLLERFEER